MISYSYVEEYIRQWRDGEIILNKRRIKLLELIERDILTADDMYFDVEQIENYIAFTEKYYFPLTLTQKFKTCFIFLYYKDGSLVFDEHLDYEGRGGGKTGRISTLANYFISELHGIDNYNVSVVANSEKQAKMSFTEVYNTIDKIDVLKDFFDHKKALIESYDTKSLFQYHTSNAGTKDGLRDGCVIFEEIHRYEDSSVINVFTSGLGKVKHPRVFYVGSDGYVREGFLDKLLERADSILDGSVSIRDDGLFPFMCCLDSEEEMHNPEVWQKANSQFHPPLSDYAQTLFKTVKKQYNKLEHDPDGYEEFITKRMNLPKVDLEKSVTSWKKIKATDQSYDLDELKSRECIGCLDYASVRDFVSAGLLFLKNDKYFIPKELTHSFICKPFADKHYAYSKNKAENNNKKDHRKFAPIKEWEEDGLLTVLDIETMDPHLIVKWFAIKRDEGWNIKKIIGDSFKMDILKPLFQAEGFEVEVIRNPDAASGLLAPRIEIAFENEQVIFGDNPLMRWYTNNVLVKRLPNGNKVYRKKEEVKRKTDGFMMFLYGVWASRDLQEETDFFLSDIKF
ncbi:terminase large subunit [Cytobacillus kochii]|uniref:terminase TerL endonuclease subunit n=1 Tax=Cytobacillus kochii TaxID=859143 RepID=UPI001CD44B70|nr:terminase TerL endonuclease subunit [Cytobacillus kochii]MCA1029370.1 terminase large subunit [Cytobacillus kochii]